LEAKWDHRGVSSRGFCRDFLPLLWLDGQQVRQALKRVPRFMCALVQPGEEVQVKTQGQELYVELKVFYSLGASLVITEPPSP